MFRKIEDFKRSFEFEKECTKKIFGALTDQSLSQAINDDHRTIGRITWHIITTYPEMMGHTGIEITGVKHDDPMPATAAEFVAAYQKVSDSLYDFVLGNWNDEKLTETDDLYGEVWEKGRTLMVLINHEIHHRGQITVLMRQAGVVVPDIYGPAKEGWAAYGAEPPVI